MEIFCCRILCRLHPENADSIDVVNENDNRLTSKGFYVCEKCKKFERELNIKE